MAENTKIQWTTHTFNPWRGCQKVNPGCASCYADTLSKRNPKTLGVWGPNGTRVVAAEDAWKLPLKWDKAAKAAMDVWLSGHQGAPYNPPPPPERPRIFCASLADVFEDWTGTMRASGKDEIYLGKDFRASRGPDDRLTMDDVRTRLFRLIDATPNLDWLLLTKRPENIAKMMPKFRDHDCDHKRASCDEVGCPGGIRPNVWLGTSVENQEQAELRHKHLMSVPAAIRFWSAEPLLGPIDAIPIWEKYGKPNWVIIGGESGPGARPCNVEWIRNIVRQCKATNVPVFVKQLGKSYFSGDNNHSHIFPRDSHGGDMAEWAKDLQVRETPKGGA